MNGRSSHARQEMAAAFLCAFCVLCGESRAEEPPLVGRPENFSGAVGSSFQVSMRAKPTELAAEESLTLTIRIQGKGNLESIHRLDLRKLPKFAERFHIEDAGERWLPQESAREFDYRLRPRNEQVQAIPGLTFVYYKPGVLPASKGYQTKTVESIPLTVKPPPVPVPEPIEAPAAFFEIVEGPEVLRTFRPYRLPGLPTPVTAILVLLLLLLPPALCAGWYAYWCLTNPDEASRARHRRSRAARAALQALHSRKPIDATQVAAIVAEYLRQRWDLLAKEPTPVEAAAHIRSAGANSEMADQTESLLQACDAERFSDVQLRGRKLSDQAERLILALEATSWSSVS